ncbi:MAG: NAD(P)/FAD-dependent oxidoreductase [Candidatus Omnitrophota bacterium]|nr:NAD(P)/FAD-dependent oxidoreductase [Candidatus Omnitrophota bacterium]
MEGYSIAVIGAGPAGMMSAITAANFTSNVVLLEKNESLGKKLLISGKGRCNLTNIGSLDNFLEHFSSTGEFLRSAFNEFFNTQLLEFFEKEGLRLKIERGGRVFPINDKSSAVLAILRKELKRLNVHLLYEAGVKDLRKELLSWFIELSDSKVIKARRVILATGAASYPLTGSTGDGFKIAAKLGHTIVPLRPGLVPLETKESWVRDLAGLSLKNIRISISQADKKISSEIGEMIFTHFGVSGPLVLELSSKVIDWFSNSKQLTLKIDLKPGLTEEQLNNRLIRDFTNFGNRSLKNLLKEFLPKRLIDICVEDCGIAANKKANQISSPERDNLIKFFKGWSLTLTRPRPLSEAIITKGGVCTKEINPRTMESRLHEGLYFCGEIIDIDADTGGYNLQAAFSTGYLAGKNAAESLN